MSTKSVVTVADNLKCWRSGEELLVSLARAELTAWWEELGETENDLVDRKDFQRGCWREPQALPWGWTQPTEDRVGTELWPGQWVLAVECWGTPLNRWGMGQPQNTANAASVRTYPPFSHHEHPLFFLSQKPVGCPCLSLPFSLTPCPFSTAKSCQLHPLKYCFCSIPASTLPLQVHPSWSCPWSRHKTQLRLFPSSPWNVSDPQLFFSPFQRFNRSPGTPASTTSQPWPEGSSPHSLPGVVVFPTYVQCSVMSDSLQPQGLQHVSLPCPSLSPPEFAQIHACWVNEAIQPSHPLLPPSPPALNLSQGLFQWVSSSHQVPKYWSFSISLPISKPNS